VGEMRDINKEIQCRIRSKSYVPMRIEVRGVNHMEQSSTDYSRPLTECVGLIAPFVELAVLTLSKLTHIFPRNSACHACTDMVKFGRRVTDESQIRANTDPADLMEKPHILDSRLYRTNKIFPSRKYIIGFRWTSDLI
jgi:hypothetical protein